MRSLAFAFQEPDYWQNAATAGFCLSASTAVRYIANAMIIIARIVGGILVIIAAINGLLFFGSLLLALFTWSATPLILALPCFVVGMILIAATDRIDLWERRKTELQEALKTKKANDRRRLRRLHDELSGQRERRAAQ